MYRPCLQTSMTRFVGGAYLVAENEWKPRNKNNQKVVLKFKI